MSSASPYELAFHSGSRSYVKLLQELLQFMPRWEAEHRTEFRVDDMSLLACLQRNIEAEAPSSTQSSLKVHQSHSRFLNLIHL